MGLLGIEDNDILVLAADEDLFHSSHLPSAHNVLKRKRSVPCNCFKIGLKFQMMTFGLKFQIMIFFPISKIVRDLQREDYHSNFFKVCQI